MPALSPRSYGTIITIFVVLEGALDSSCAIFVLVSLVKHLFVDILAIGLLLLLLLLVVGIVVDAALVLVPVWDVCLGLVSVVSVTVHRIVEIGPIAEVLDLTLLLLLLLALLLLLFLAVRIFDLLKFLVLY